MSVWRVGGCVRIYYAKWVVIWGSNFSVRFRYVYFWTRPLSLWKCVQRLCRCLLILALMPRRGFLCFCFYFYLFIFFIVMYFPQISHFFVCCYSSRYTKNGMPTVFTPSCRNFKHHFAALAFSTQATVFSTLPCNRLQLTVYYHQSVNKFAKFCLFTAFSRKRTLSK